MRIFSYVVRRDYGFAPNPFFGICTLATCKPIIRKHATVGDIVVGTRSVPRQHEIVYFMEVQEIASFEEYWRDARFKLKKPDLYVAEKYAYGDNIYHRNSSGDWIQEDSHHTYPDGSPVEANIRTDTSVDRVLISTNFCYWGEKSIPIPKIFHEIVKAGPGHKCNFDPEFANRAREWLMNQGRGVLGDPLSW